MVIKNYVSVFFIKEPLLIPISIVGWKNPMYIRDGISVLLLLQQMNHLLSDLQEGFDSYDQKKKKNDLHPDIMFYPFP